MKYCLTLSLLTIALRLSAAPAPQAVELPTKIVMNLELGLRATAMTRPLIGRLSLNEGEYVRLRALHQILLASLDDINAQYAGDADAKRAKLQELQGQYERERLRVLSPSQIGHLQAQPTNDALPTIDLNSGGLG